MSSYDARGLRDLVPLLVGTQLRRLYVCVTLDIAGPARYAHSIDLGTLTAVKMLGG